MGINEALTSSSTSVEKKLQVSVATGGVDLFDSAGITKHLKS